MNETDDLSERNTLLREALRAGDPAGDPTALDVDRLRRRLRAAREEHAARPSWRPWLALGAVAASLAALWLVIAPSRQALPSFAPVRGGASAAAREVARETLASGGEVRQMQFETPGGTRIIWVMAARLD